MKTLATIKITVKIFPSIHWAHFRKTDRGDGDDGHIKGIDQTVPGYEHIAQNSKKQHGRHQRNGQIHFRTEKVQHIYRSKTEVRFVYTRSLIFNQKAKKRYNAKPNPRVTKVR